ncbi:uncharacterized protein LOC121917846 [Sceloporus undulatus]|uniref:uncharacterized protein LOC121917846 n=1 Tax=Sceloporus undulatus TaxID=8520 RepID=UPI001C4C47BD|nr:uncharacterized protein LOC121917846 [Sceloporus undulatus]
MASFKQCAKCGVKIPMSDGHDKCVLCLGEGHIPGACRHCKAMTAQALKNRDQKLKASLYEKAFHPSSTGDDPGTSDTHKIANYAACMGAYVQLLMEKMDPIISELPDDKKRIMSAIRNEAHSVGGQQIISARHSTDCSSKILSGSVALRRYAWLRSSDLTPQAKAAIEDMPFDNSGLFNKETDEKLSFRYRMKTAAKKHGMSASSSRPAKQRYSGQRNWFHHGQQRFHHPERQFQPQDSTRQGGRSRSPSQQDRRQPSQSRYQPGYKKKDARGKKRF